MYQCPFCEPTPGAVPCAGCGGAGKHFLPRPNVARLAGHVGPYVALYRAQARKQAEVRPCPLSLSTHAVLPLLFFRPPALPPRARAPSPRCVAQDEARKRRAAGKPPTSPYALGPVIPADAAAGRRGLGAVDRPASAAAAGPGRPAGVESAAPSTGKASGAAGASPAAKPSAASAGSGSAGPPAGGAAGGAAPVRKPVAFKLSRAENDLPL